MHLKTSSGNCKLRIDAAATPALEFYESGTRNSDIMVADSSNELVITNRQNASINFRTNGANERARIDSSGRLLIGHTTTLVTEGSLQQQIVGTDFGTSGSALLRFQDGTSGPTIAFAHSRNGTKGSHTILADNDEFGKIRFYGSDGTDFNNYGAEIRAVVNGTPGANDMPGALTFGTTADGATGSTERMRIDSSGRVLIGTQKTYSDASSVSYTHLTLPTKA